MTEHTPSIDWFKQQVRAVLREDTLNIRTVMVSKHDHVYTCGERDEKIYFIESGQVKLLLLSPEGKECLTSIYTTGDVFGELCLCGQTERLETAVAMTNSTIRQVQSRAFLSILRSKSLLEGLVQYLAFRVAEREQIITSLLTVNSEQRLAMTLLRLGHKLGRKDPRSLLIPHRISHEELAEMVGTTRSRIGCFLKKFRRLGLIDLTGERHLILREMKIAEYLSRLDLDEDVDSDSTKSLGPRLLDLARPSESAMPDDTGILTENPQF